MFSSTISSCVLITAPPASAAGRRPPACPSRCKAQDDGSTRRSRPARRPARSSSSPAIFAATSSARPILAACAPRIVEMPAGERPSSAKGSTGRGGAGAEVPDVGSSPLREQAETIELVDRPRADMCRRDVADVAHVEAAATRAPRRQTLVDPRQALVAKAVVPDGSSQSTPMVP